MKIRQTKTTRQILLLVCLAVVSTIPASAIPPLPARIGGTITVDGTVLTQTSAGSDYTISVKKPDNTDFSPAARTSSLNLFNSYIIDIPIYDQTDQPNGARSGDSAVIHVTYQGTELTVTSPANGRITVRDSGSITEINLVVTGSPGGTSNPVISVSPSSIDFGPVQVGSSSEQSLTVTNVGGGTLSGTATVSAAFSIVSGGSYNLSANQPQIVTVRFSPTAAQSYTGTVLFTGGGGATRTVTGTGATAPTYSLTTSLNPTDGGSIARSPNQTSFSPGTQVTLTAVPNSGFTFSSWSGDASGSSNTVTVTMDRNRSITANFTATLCTYSISPSSASYSAAGGQGSFQVTTGAGCTWTASANVTWITITSAIAGTGNTTVTYSLSANTTTSQRSGGINVGAQTFSITQAGSGTPASGVPTVGTVTPNTATGQSPSFSHTSNGELLIVIAHANAPTVTSVTYAGANLTKGTEQTLNGPVSIWYKTNPASGSNPVQVNYTSPPGTQAQIAMNVSGADITNPIGAATGSNAASGQPSSDTITTTVANSLILDALTLLSQEESIISPAANQTTQYLLTEQSRQAGSTRNAAAPGTYAMTWSFSQNRQYAHAIVEIRARPASVTCSYSISPSTASHVSAGGTGTFQVSASSGCSWSASSDMSWITITSGGGSGDGVVTYTVAGTTSVSARTGRITIQDRIFTITQTGTAVVDLTLNILANPSDGGRVERSPNQALYAPGTSVALTAIPTTGYIFSGWSGDASGTANRISVLMDRSKVVTANFTSSSCSFAISPSTRSHGSIAESGSILVTTNTGCAWTATADVTWITIVSGAGSGNGSVSYSVSANTTTTAREGRITVQGKTYVVTQAGQNQSSSPTTLNFPRLISITDMGMTGIAIVNPDSSDAAVSFRLFNQNGNEIAVSNQTISARGQLARLVSQLFPSVSSGGWIQATSSVLGLQAFWLGGDFATHTDGAEAGTPATDQILPLITDQTEINIANPGPASITVTIRLRDTTGSEMAPTVVQGINGRGVLQVPATAIFPTASISTTRPSIRITASGSFVATSVIRGFLGSRDSAVINGMNAAPSGAGPFELNFPHAISGPIGIANYITVIGVTNLSSGSNSYTLTFTDESGRTISSGATMAPNASMWELAHNLLTFPTGFQNGWLKITGTAPISGFVAYLDTISGGVAVVPAQSAPQTGMFFAHIADLSPWYTGIALLNATSTAAQVELFAMTPEGTLIGGASSLGNARFALPARSKTSRLLSELIPQTQSRRSDGGFLFVRSANNVPLYGIELFFLRNLSVLSNVAGSGLPSGTTYTPPDPEISSAGAITALAIDPRNTATIFAASSTGGIFKSTNGGQSWVAANSGLTYRNVGGGFGEVSAIAIDPLDTATIYAGTNGGGVFKSSDGGRNWTALNSGLSLGERFVQALVIDPSNPNVLYLGTLASNAAGVFKSTNGGQTWSTSNSGLPFTHGSALAIHPRNSATLYLGAGNGPVPGAVHKSTNGGQSWSQTGLINVGISGVVVDPVNPNTVYAVGFNAVYKSTNEGQSWTASYTSASVLAIDPTRPSTILAAGAQGIFKSINSGESWTQLSALATRSLSIDPINSNVMYAGTNEAGVLKSTDGGITWQPANGT